MFISRRKINFLEKRIADLEGRVQSQQKILKEHIETDNEFNNKIIELSNMILNIQTNLSKG